MVEGLSQFADLGSALQRDALREVAACQRPAGLCQDHQWCGDAPRSKERDQNACERHGQSEPLRRSLHFQHACVSRGLRLLRYHSPAKISHRAVGAEHLYLPSAFIDGELARGYDLILRVIEKVFDDLVTRHVLTSRKCRIACSNKSSIVVNDIGFEVAAAGF